MSPSYHPAILGAVVLLCAGCSSGSRGSSGGAPGSTGAPTAGMPPTPTAGSPPVGANPPAAGNPPVAGNPPPAAGNPPVAGGGAAAGGSGGSGSGGSWSYIGVPHPTDDLPEEIMPALPDGVNRQPGWPYDPTAIATPTWPGDGPHHYYVAHDGDDGTAGNGGNGNPAAPRRSMPGYGPFPAGTLIFLEGDGTPLPTSETTNRRSDFPGWTSPNASLEMNPAGTYADPSDIAWIVGIDRPRLTANADTSLTNSHHVIFDGVILDGIRSSDPNRSGRLRIGQSSHITFRNGAQYGEHADRGGSLFDLNDADYVMYFNNEMAYAGDFDAISAKDFHGVRPAYGNRWVWVIDNHIHHLSGDGMQTGNSNNTRPIGETSHYIYFAGNDCHDNRENAVDNKNSFHVVVSQNRLHDFTGAGGGGSNGTALILANDNEGPHSAYHWAIANEVRDSTHGIRDGGNSAAPNKSFMIGNLVHDIAGAGLAAWHASPDQPGTESHMVNNTVARCGSGIDINFWQPSNPTSVFINRNVIFECSEDIVIGGRNIDRYQVVDNVIFKAGGGERIDAEGRTQTVAGNLLGIDPLLVAPAANDLSLQAGSPARDLTTEDPVYGLFESLYGIDIRRDFSGRPRPGDGTWDAGSQRF